ncbi:MAG: hypothetical protein HYS05_04010 [Acidobacteria bacterium]|nr:hypothetical protein [Acidobacteriota bacterium]
MTEQLWIVAGTAASYLVGAWLGIPALVPVLNTLPAFPFLLLALKEEKTALAVTRMLVWALALAVCATTLAYLQPARTERLFFNAAAYRREMLDWIMTGRGAEGRPSQFIPQHLLHATVFVALALATGSVLAMPMGAVLMNYMGHYVGSLAAASPHPFEVLLLGWHPWAIVRVASFVTLGVVLGGPVLARLAGFRYRLANHLPLVGLAVVGLAVDVIMKWLLAATWAQLIRDSL